MKQFLTTILLFFSIIASGQTYKVYKTQNIHNYLRLNTETGEILQVQDDGGSWFVCGGVESDSTTAGRFELYATQNIWTYLMLDTVQGRIWRVQFSVEGDDYRYADPIIIDSQLPGLDKSVAPDRFQLYATQNMWTYLMLDTKLGKVWQVQFSTKGREYQFAYPFMYDSQLESWENADIVDRFALYATQNMWTFIMLDRCSGRLWQVQYSTEELSKSFSVVINNDRLSYSSPRVFSIEPMTSMYQFLLLNEQSGQMWQFQWTTDGADYRWIKKLDLPKRLYDSL